LGKGVVGTPALFAEGSDPFFGFSRPQFFFLRTCPLRLAKTDNQAGKEKTIKKGKPTMNKKAKSIESDLVIGAILKLDQPNGERQNVLMFIQSCYGGRVRNYDLDAAVQSLAKLTDVEQHALMAYVARLC
jgi:hypothetical protein